MNNQRKKIIQFNSPEGPVWRWETAEDKLLALLNTPEGSEEEYMENEEEDERSERESQEPSEGYPK